MNNQEAEQRPRDVYIVPDTELAVKPSATQEPAQAISLACDPMDIRVYAVDSDFGKGIAWHIDRVLEQMAADGMELLDIRYVATPMTDAGCSGMERSALLIGRKANRGAAWRAELARPRAGRPF